MHELFSLTIQKENVAMETSVKKPSFFAYLLAFIAPPLYFFTRGRIIAGIFSLIMLFVAIPFFFVFGFGIIIWIAMAFWAMYSLGNEVADARSQDQANRTADAIVKAQRKEREEMT